MSSHPGTGLQKSKARSRNNSNEATVTVHMVGDGGVLGHGQIHLYVLISEVDIN